MLNNIKYEQCDASFVHYLCKRMMIIENLQWCRCNNTPETILKWVRVRLTHFKDEMDD